VQALVDLYQFFCAGLNSPGKPVGNLLFLGQPDRARRALWKRREILFPRRARGDKSGLRGIPASHEIAKLIGSPPATSAIAKLIR